LRIQRGRLIGIAGAERADGADLLARLGGGPDRREIFDTLPIVGDEVVADHPRATSGAIIYDPWHYLPVLMNRPGALRNGAPFKDWDLPPALASSRAAEGRRDDHRRVPQPFCV
jgi:hypothetical protein